MSNVQKGSQSYQRKAASRGPAGLAFVLTVLACLQALPAAATSLIYKDYIIRYDRGWDVLCEPYTVKKDDWVLKIFRQKGEIAHDDFREFLGIFQRLNPQIKDANMVRPGQTIDIPLRKLEHGSLPGQATGVVTIPFVTLSQVTDVVRTHAKQHQVRWGDTVSQLIARHYGRFGSASYEEGIKLFQAANPQIEDLNRIYAGQKVYLPDPVIRDKSWYASLYDEQGRLKKALDSRQTPASALLPPGAPAPGTGEQSQDKLQTVAQTVGGRLLDKGTYFVPRTGGEDFELDLSRQPLLEMGAKDKIVFSRDGKAMGEDQQTLSGFWSEAKIVAYDEDATVAEIVGSVLNAVKDNSAFIESSETGFSDQGVQVVVRAKWINSADDQRKLCITPVASHEEKTPEAMRRYLEQNGIVIREVLSGENGDAKVPPVESQRHAVKNILALAPGSQKEFVRDLARSLSFTFASDVGISFPYAGIQVTAYAHLLSTGQGQEVLIDFGDLYGDAVEAIRQSGPQLVQISADEEYTAIVYKLFTALDLTYVDNPTFLAARRPAEFNTTVTVPGILYAKSETQQVLLSHASLHPAVTDLLSEAAVDVVIW